MYFSLKIKILLIFFIFLLLKKKNFFLFFNIKKQSNIFIYIKDCDINLNKIASEAMDNKNNIKLVYKINTTL